MRRVMFALLVGAQACDTNAAVLPTTVHWMEWPATVLVQDPFKVRMIVDWPCAAEGFRAGPSADESAVTFAPYFLKHTDDVLCVAAGPASLVIGGLDTAAFAPGLPADYTRTYELRAAAEVFAQPLANRLPVRTFGIVTVTLAAPTAPVVRNAAGRVFLNVDTVGCARVQPVGLYSPSGGYVLENPIDTAGLSGTFVRGYLYQPAVPRCGETQVFHLTGRN